MNLKNKLTAVVNGSLWRRSALTGIAVFISAIIGITIETLGIIEMEGLLAFVLPVPIFISLVAILAGKGNEWQLKEDMESEVAGSTNPIVRRPQGAPNYLLFYEKDATIRVTGKVKWFDAKKGFGFIEHEGGKDVFVHYSSIKGDGFSTLKDGENVEFDIVKDADGDQAKNVRKAHSKKE